MAQKDYKRQSTRTKQVSITSLMARITVEDIYTWLRKGYLEVKDDINLIRRAFELSGFIPIRNSAEASIKENDKELDELSNQIEQMIFKEENIEPLPLDDEEYEDEKPSMFLHEKDDLEEENMQMNSKSPTPEIYGKIKFR